VSTCANCGHTSPHAPAPNTTPGWPMKTMRCAQCPDGLCILPDEPAGWTEAEKVIDQALQTITVPGGFACGHVNARIIADALQAAGLLNEPPSPAEKDTEEHSA
jgi:hypothetical protein